jgi:hypothetical protein
MKTLTSLLAVATLVLGSLAADPGLATAQEEVGATSAGAGLVAQQGVYYDVQIYNSQTGRWVHSRSYPDLAQAQSWAAYVESLGYVVRIVSFRP